MIQLRCGEEGDTPLHELAVARNIVEIVTQVARDENASAVSVIHLEVGELSCVAPAALEFVFQAVAAGTPAEGAKLEFTPKPVVIYCPECEEQVCLKSPQRFRCPLCDRPTAELVSGKELLVAKVELVDETLSADS